MKFVPVADSFVIQIHQVKHDRIESSVTLWLSHIYTAHTLVLPSTQSLKTVLSLPSTVVHSLHMKTQWANRVFGRQTLASSTFRNRQQKTFEKLMQRYCFFDIALVVQLLRQNNKIRIENQPTKKEKEVTRSKTNREKRKSFSRAIFVVPQGKERTGKSQLHAHSVTTHALTQCKCSIENKFSIFICTSIKSR